MGEGKLLDLELIQLTKEKVRLTEERMKTSLNRQKSYVDNRRRELASRKGDLAFAKVSPSKRQHTLRKKGKSNPWYTGPFEILEKMGTVAYFLVHTYFTLPKYEPDLACPR